MGALFDTEKEMIQMKQQNAPPVLRRGAVWTASAWMRTTGRISRRKGIWWITRS
jgi:hypothetical protein